MINDDDDDEEKKKTQMDGYFILDSSLPKALHKSNEVCVFFFLHFNFFVVYDLPLDNDDDEDDDDYYNYNDHDNENYLRQKKRRALNSTSL